MAQEFLGSGWAFPVQLDAGAVTEAREEGKVRQSIEIILRTSPGERVTRLDFGCGIHDLVFETVSEDLLGRVQSVVSDALRRWEPRIDVVRVDARPDPQDALRLLIAIDYRVRSTNSRFNLVFPFYLE